MLRHPYPSVLANQHHSTAALTRSAAAWSRHSSSSFFSLDAPSRACWASVVSSALRSSAAAAYSSSNDRGHVG